MSIKQISFKTLLLTVGFILFSATSSLAGPKILKASTGGNQDSFAYKAFVDMAKFIDEESKGKYKLETYDSYKLGNPDTVTQGIQFGTIHFAQEGTNNMTAFTPLLSIFDLPYVFQTREDFRKIFNGEFGEEIAERASNKTIRYLGFSECDFRKMFLNEQVKTLEQLQKIRLRTTLSKIHNAAINALGMSASPMPVMETFTAVQQGVVGGVDIDLSWGRIFNFQEVAPYIYETNHLYTPQVIFTGQRWWSSLSAADRELFKKAAKVWTTSASKYYLEDIDKARAFMLESGVEFIQPTPEDAQRMVELVAPLYKTLPKAQAELLAETQEILK